jgi:hypothetical protein
MRPVRMHYSPTRSDLTHLHHDIQVLVLKGRDEAEGVSEASIASHPRFRYLGTDPPIRSSCHKLSVPEGISYPLTPL